MSREELNQLDEWLLSHCEQLEAKTGRPVNCIYCVSELDGFFTAIVSGPSMILPSEWYPVIWGGHPPVFDTEQQAGSLMSLLMRQMNSIVDQLLDGSGSFEPLFYHRIANQQQYLVVDEWCSGYLRGMRLRDEEWQSLVDEKFEWLTPLVFFGMAQTPEDKEISEETRTALRNKIPSIARKIYHYWLSKRTPVPTKRTAQKIGRNDPCPCGSGKKHKHCCLH